jgi:predicted dehydrogenase
MHMIRIGLFGIGHLGKIHLKILKGLPQYFNVVGIHDIDRNAGLAVQEEFNVPFFETSALTG